MSILRWIEEYLGFGKMNTPFDRWWLKRKGKKSMALAHTTTPGLSHVVDGKLGIETSRNLVIVSVGDENEKIEISLNANEARRLFDTLRLRF